MLEVSVPLHTKGRLLFDFVDASHVYVTTSNETVDKELFLTNKCPTYTQWHARYILEAIREAVEVYDERQRAPVAAIQKS